MCLNSSGHRQWQYGMLLMTSIILVAAVMSVLPQASASRPSPYFPNCSESFSCGMLRNISYPFTGGTRPVFCGPPGFRLRCTDDSIPELLSDALTYRILELDPVLQRMTLSRSDLYSSLCPHKFMNTTLNPAVFDDSGNVNLTLLYGCSNDHQQFVDSFSCSDGNGGGFYLVGPGVGGQILGCNISVTVPLPRITAADLGRNRSLNVGDVLMKGFGVSYRDPAAAECRKCLQSGGQCGFSGGPICICGDTLCHNTASKTQTLGLGLGIGGAAIASVVVCGWGVLIMQRKWRSRTTTAEILLSSRDPTHSTIISTTTKTSKTTTSLMITNSTTTTASTYFGAHVFPYSELEEATDKFNPSKELGDGGFGTVYYGVLCDGREVAVKRLYENNLRGVEQFMNEVEILTRLRHPNLVALYGCTSRHSRELLLVYEYIPNGTLSDHLHGGHLLPWSVRMSVAIETANALAYLHASDAIHRDVKSTNILLDNDFHVKVADFGLSRFFPDDVSHVSTAPQGTPGYVDPEYYQIYHLTTKSDVYSFGVVLMELISAKPAVDTTRHRHDINLATMAIKRIQDHALHDLIDPSLGFENDFSVKRMVTSVAELAFRCLQMQSEARPSMEQVAEILKEIRNDQPEVVDIDMLLVKQMSPPLSPENKYWVSHHDQ